MGITKFFFRSNFCQTTKELSDSCAQLFRFYFVSFSDTVADLHIQMTMFYLLIDSVPLPYLVRIFSQVQHLRSEINGKLMIVNLGIEK